MMDDKFFDDVASLIEQARKHIGRTADLTMCFTNYVIGGMIVEKEQAGKRRAQYGKGIIAELSIYLNARFGRGFSETNLKILENSTRFICRQFSRTFLLNSMLTNGSRNMRMPRQAEKLRKRNYDGSYGK